MRVSLEWLNDYVDTQGVPAQTIADRLTMAGIAVEAIDKDEDDTIMELELTPNRGDCNGLVNVAREVCALFGGKVKLPPVALKETGKGKTSDYISVRIEDPDLCRRYVARAVTDVRIAPSPQWMQKRLLRAGVRPINNIVDITNYVMLETNQPLHAFDHRMLEGPEIRVRRASSEEKFVTLDGAVRELNEDSLLICDAKKAVALAGIMGGLNSEIEDDTTTVLLESANFHPTNIRRTAVRLGLRTESSQRFEKGLSPEQALFAVNRAARLIEELGAGRVVPGVVDVYPEPETPLEIVLRPARVNHLLGSDLDARTMTDYLERLGFTVKKSGSEYLVRVPYHRVDVFGEADLIEEIARLFGYDNLPSSLPIGSGSVTGYRRRTFQDRVVEILARNMNEVITYSFISPRVLERLRLPADSRLANPIRLANPLSEEQSVMRTTLLPGLLEAAARNLARQNEDVAIFEAGTVFFPSAAEPAEEVRMVAGLVTGKTAVTSHRPRLDMDFFYLKGIVEDLLSSLGISQAEFRPESSRETFHPGRTAEVWCQGQFLGVIGEIHPRVADSFDIKKRVVAFEFSLPGLEQAAPVGVRVNEIPRYPATVRDIAIVVDEEVPSSAVEAVVGEVAGDLLRQALIFDVYRSPQLGEGKKSLAITLRFQAFDRTLRDEEVNALTKSIMDRLEEKLGASAR